MRLNTIINSFLGSILSILLLISFSAYYQTDKTNLGLNAVLDEHIPALQVLMQNQKLLSATNLLFEESIKVDRVLLSETLSSLPYLVEVAKQLEATDASNNSQKITVRQLIEGLSAQVQQSPALDDISPAAVTKRQTDWSEIQIKIGQLRVQVQDWFQRQAVAHPKQQSVALAFSRLLNNVEIDLSRYYSQTYLPPERLLEPLGQCLLNVNKLEKENSQLLATFSTEDKKLLANLSLSFQRYRSAIILYYDEEALGVSGENLNEILYQVVSAREQAEKGLESLSQTVIGRTNKIQQQIVRSSEVLQNLFLFVALLGVLAVLSASLILSKTLTKRIGELLQGAETIASGDLNIRIKVKPQGDQLGRLGKAFNSMADSLQQREAEKNESLKKLAQAQKMEAIGLMAGGVAHDLNNILAGIVGYPELLLSELDENSKLHRPLQIIRDSGRRAADVVSDLLTVARGAAARKEIHNANLLIDEYLYSPEGKKLFAGHGKVACRKELDPNLLNMNCSAIHFKKCIMNLVINAVEAIEESGQVTISTQNQYFQQPVELMQTLLSGEYVEVRVSDTGDGMSREDLQRVFEPFYSKKALGKSGTGLGLPVVWNTILDHDGGISVESDSSGTTFTLYFPATRAAMAIAAESFDTDKLKGDGELVLVIDDELQQRDIASRMLILLGYRVETMASGEEAVEYLRENKVDLLLLDMIMDPGISGRETFEKILEIHPQQKAVIASGFSESEDVLRVQELSCAKYIKKPYTLNQLGLAVKQSLQSDRD